MENSDKLPPKTTTNKDITISSDDQITNINTELKNPTRAKEKEKGFKEGLGNNSDTEKK